MSEKADGWLDQLPLETIGTSAGWFTSELATRGLDLIGGSAMHVALATLADFRAKTVAGQTLSLKSAEGVYSYIAEATGADFITKIIHRAAEAGLVLPDDKWKLLRSGDPLITRANPRTSAERNKTWEVVIASLAATFASDVEFNEAAGDVTCRFKDHTCAIAAKVAYSDEKVERNILKGLEQTDGKADLSLILVDVVTLYPQVANFDFSISRGYKNDGRAVRDTKASVARWCDAKWDLPRLTAQIRTKATRPVGVVFFLPLLIQVEGTPAPFLYTHMPLTWEDDVGPDYEFARAFLDACNTVLGFTPRGTACRDALSSSAERRE